MEINISTDFYAGRRVFVTGHTGFKGSWLCQMLISMGAQVTGYSLNPPTTPSLFALLGLEGRMNSIIGDIRDFDSLKKSFEEASPEVVLHLAAQPIVLTSYEQPRYTYDVNVMGTVNILECVRLSCSVKSFVNITTDKVYENRELCTAFTEDEPLNGFDPYSNSKSCSELVTSAYKNSFPHMPPISTARAGNVIGGGDFSDNRIIPDCIRAVLSKETLILRNPNSIRPYQHVLEPLTLYLKIAQAQYENNAFADSYNIGPDEDDCVTSETIVKLFAQQFTGFDYEVRVNPDAPHEAGFLKLNNRKIKRVFDYKPKLKINDAVRLTADWVEVYLSGGDVRAITEEQTKEFIKR